MRAEPQQTGFEQALSVRLPSRRDERWKWTDLRAALREPMPASAPAVTARAPLLAIDGALEFVFANGHLASAPDSLPDGMQVTREDGDDRLPKEILAGVAHEKAEARHVIRITGTLTQPLHLRFLSEGNGMHHTAIEVILEDGAEASVIESLEGGEGAWFANGLLRFTLGTGASLERLIVQQAGPDAVQIHHATATLAAGAAFTQATLGFGAKLCRLETQLTHQGEGARAVLNGAYLLSGKAHLDNTTDVTHAVPGAVTEELYKGVLTGKSRGVFQGRFFVARDAQQTDARMAHNALLLSDEAEVDAKPELMIYADDVQCAHGNTVGALDEEALFYMRQRGLTEHAARALLIQAFVAGAFDAVASDDLRAALTGLIDSWLEAR